MQKLHRIIKAHLNDFAKSFAVNHECEAIQFEKFCTYSVISSKIGSNYEIDDVTTGSNDDGIDGVAVIIDEEVIVSAEDARRVFSSPRRNHDVEVVFIQAKRSESFDQGEFYKFKEAIYRFVSADEIDSDDPSLCAAREVLDIVLENVPKLRLGKPSLIARFVATGQYQAPRALERAKGEAQNQLTSLSLFYRVDIQFIDRDLLTSLWVSTYSGVTAQLDFFSHAPLPDIHGIHEAYLAVVKAKDLVENLLTTEDGNLRAQVFEENVRAYLGSDNPVNNSIQSTLEKPDTATRFPVLNNGITIVSPDVRVQGSTLHLSDYQIVNGCQTSNVLFENKSELDDRVMVNVKVVETGNEDVFSELVRATNSQTKVDETQFLSLQPISKKVEEYFNTFEGYESRVYFERRERQYVGRDIAAIRIFNIQTAAKGVAAMFCNRPDLAFKFPKRMYEELADTMFHYYNDESIFYAACLSLYRLHLLVSNNVIPQNSRKYKWHILALMRAILCGKKVPPLNSRKIGRQTSKIIDTVSYHNDHCIAPFQKAVKIISSIDEVTDDRLKRQAILDEMMEKLNS